MRDSRPADQQDRDHSIQMWLDGDTGVVTHDVDVTVYKAIYQELGESGRHKLLEGFSHRVMTRIDLEGRLQPDSGVSFVITTGIVMLGTLLAWLALAMILQVLGVSLVYDSLMLLTTLIGKAVQVILPAVYGLTIAGLVLGLDSFIRRRGRPV